MAKPEAKMCKAFVRQLEDLIQYGQIARPASFRYWHNDNGQRAGKDFKARAIAGKEAKALGVMCGLYDYEFLWRDASDVPFMGFLEAKSDTGELTPEQEDFRRFCIAEKIPNGEFRTPLQGLRILQSWGVFKEGVIL